METQPKITLTMNGMEILADPGMTILDAAKAQGIRIPTLCHHPALSAWGGCRMCVVEVDGSPKLVASCVTPVRNGMSVVTSNANIIKSRRAMLEFIFAERNHNCMFCPQSGDCELQQLAYELQMDHLTVSFSFNQFPVDVTSEYMAIDHNRCILCSRCVRACKEIAGAWVLNFQNRGPESLIGMDLNETREESGCFNCGICVQVCPTGAMVNRYRGHYAVKGHAKDSRQIESVCPQCGLLCSTVISVKDNNPMKIEGRLAGNDGRPDRGQLCYKGRFEALKNKQKRLESPMVRSENGTWRAATWDEVLERVSSKLNAIKSETGGEAIFGLASSAACNEELFFFKELMTKGWAAAYLDTFDGSHFRTLTWALKQAAQNYREASWHMLPEADVVVLLGADACRSQPLISSLLHRNILEKNQKVFVMGASNPVPAYTPYYFPVKDKDLPLVIQALKSGMMKQGGAKNLLKKAGIGATAVPTFHEMTAVLSHAANPLFLAGVNLTGLGDVPALADVVNLAEQTGRHAGKAPRLIVLKPCGNSAGAWKLGMPSMKNPARNRRWKGGLVLLHELDPSYPAAIERISRAEFTAVISAFFPEALADKVHVLIPKPVWMEEEGTYASLDGLETAYKQKTLRAPEWVKDSHQIFRNLAERIGYVPEHRSWQELTQRTENEIKHRTLST